MSQNIECNWDKNFFRYVNVDNLGANMFIVALLAMAMPSSFMDESLDADLDKSLCGLHAINNVNTFISGNSDLETFKLLLSEYSSPYSFSELDDAIITYGLKSRLFHWKDKHAAKLSCPSILHIRSERLHGPPDHFVACYGELDGSVVIADYPHPPIKVSRSHLNNIWDGDVLYIDKINGVNLNQVIFEWKLGLWLKIINYLNVFLALFSVLLVLLQRFGFFKKRTAQ